MNVAQQQEDKFANQDIDELLSRYALAYKNEDFESSQEIRHEILRRIGSLRTIQYTLNNILL